MVGPKLMSALKIKQAAITALVFALFINITIHHFSVAVNKEHILFEFTEWHVYVVNGLSNCSQLLSVHCRSKDNDLGVHYLSTGANFTWSFRENFFQRTLFWCNVSKDGTHAVFKVFWHDVYLFYKCRWKHCFWTAKDDGIYIKDLDHEGLDELYYGWEPGQEN